MSHVPKAAPGKSIFLCYRRYDSEEVVDRIYDTLAEQLPEETLFRDIDDIDPGADFTAVIRDRLRDCHLVLVFIGRDWLTIQTGGQRRLDDPSDHVLLEVQTALALPFARVIPVLVKRAVMPKADQLPPSLSGLLKLNALTIRSTGLDYKHDMTELVKQAKQGIFEAKGKRTAVEEREREEIRHQAWVAQGGTGPLPQSLDENQWKELLEALEAETVVVICGSEFGTDPAIGEPVCRETPLAASIANTMGLPVPPLDASRPLAKLAARCLQEGRRNEFTRALCKAADAAVAPKPVTGLELIQNIEPLRIFLTSALDHGLEAALASRSVGKVASVAYTPAEPLGLDNIDLTHVPALVFHVAGFAGGLPGDSAVTDVDWRNFADAWRERPPKKLPELFEDKSLLILGDGHPAGFVEFWIELASRLHCHRLWIGFSVFSHNPALTGFLRENAGYQQILFDDSGEPTFLAELARRWVNRPPKPPPVVAQVEWQTVRKPMPSKRDKRDEHPWPGLAPFYEEHHSVLSGRREEILLLVKAMRFHPVTVLFSASGMGKTSLLNAGLIPALRERGVVPVRLRIDWKPDAPPFHTQVLQAVIAEATRSSIAFPDLGSNASLWTFFHHINVVPPTAGDEQPRFALLFDQFEEFFTFGATTPDAAKRALVGWEELADLVEGRLPSKVRDLFDRDPSALSAYSFVSPAPPVLLSLREDFLPMMESLSNNMPSLSRSRFRLCGLSRAQALDVVLQGGGPAAIFTEEAAHALVESLASGSQTAIGASEYPFETSRVDPAILNLLCRNLNEYRLAQGLEHVDASMLQNSSRVLEFFYEHSFADLSPSVRDWVEDELVTTGGLRDSMSLERAKSGIPLKAIDTLVDRRLLRVSESGGIPRIELSHDALVPLVRESRDARLRSKSNRDSLFPGMTFFRRFWKK